MSKIFFLGAVMGAALVVTGCATGPAPGNESVSIAYDPYDFDPDDLQAEADSHCSAYNLRAVFEDETIDEQSVRWRYRHFRCV